MTPRRFVTGLLLIAGLLAACATMPPSPTATAPPPTAPPSPTLVPTQPPAPTVAPTPAPLIAVPTLAKPTEPAPLIAADQTLFEGKVDIGGRALFLTCYGKGEPTIVMDGFIWNSGGELLGVMPELLKVSRACIYARPNTYRSQSDPVKETRTSKDIVADLHALLGKAGLKPPYILVGLEFGALNQTLYAAQYPKEVVGLVLVQPEAPGAYQAFLDLVPKSTIATSIPAQKFRAFWEDWVKGVFANSRDVPVDARVDVLASEKQVFEVKTLGNLPIHVVRPRSMTFEAPEPAITLKMEQIYFERLEFYTKLSTKVEQSVEVADGTAMVGPILKLVDKARGK